MANKVIKVSATQLKSIIAEEASKYKKVLELEKKKASIMSQLNEMYETQELQELGIDEGLFGGKSTEEVFAEKSKQYDTEAQAWINGLIAKNPNLNVQLYQDAVAKQKDAVVKNVAARAKELGAKGGKFTFLTKGGKLIVQYNQDNSIPSTGIANPGAGSV